MSLFILTILFGNWGIYRFHKKQYFLGFVYIFTMGLFGIGWLVDIFKAYGEWHNSTQTSDDVNVSDLFPPAEFHPNYAHQKNYVIYDFETTGLDANTCEIVEIGAIKITDGIISDTFQTLVKPSKPIPSNASKVNHITNEMVKNAPTATRIFPSFLDFIGDLPLCGYNIRKYDHVILRRYAIKFCNKILTNYITDVFLIAQKNLDLPKYTLSDVARHFGIPLTNAHRAMGDCEVTFECFKRLQEIRKGYDK